MKKSYIICLVSLIIILLSSYLVIINKNSPIQKEEKTVNFNKILGDTKIGKGSLKSQESIKWEIEFGRKTGIYSKKIGIYQGYLIGLGKRPTGGYSINISTSTESGKLKIYYEEKTPKQNSFNIQAITYNYNVIYFKKGDFKVEIYQLLNGKKVLKFQE